MNNFCLLSFCSNVVYTKSFVRVSLPFKGAYKGYKINQVILFGDANNLKKIKKNQCYLIFAQKIDISAGNELFGKIIKIKLIEYLENEFEIY